MLSLVYGAVVRIANIPTIIGDALVVGLTWLKTYDQLKIGRKLHMNTSLSMLFLRDGTLYFMCVNLVETRFIRCSSNALT